MAQNNNATIVATPRVVTDNGSQAEIKVTTMSITELSGSILIDQLAIKFPELIHSNTL